MTRVFASLSEQASSTHFHCAPPSLHCRGGDARVFWFGERESGWSGLSCHRSAHTPAPNAEKGALTAVSVHDVPRPTSDEAGRHAHGPLRSRSLRVSYVCVSPVGPSAINQVHLTRFTSFKHGVKKQKNTRSLGPLNLSPTLKSGFSG